MAISHDVSEYVVFQSHENLNEDGPILSVAKWILVFGSIRFMWIFTGVFWTGGVK